MAGPGFGRNAGISGIIALTAADGASVQFVGKFYVWKTKLQGETKRRRGRGSTSFDTLRYLATGGNLLFIGKPSQTDFPAPGTFRGAVGTATLTINVGKTVAYPLMVGAIDWDFNEKTEDSPTYTIAANPTAAPTYTGWRGPQQTETTASKSDQEQYGGTSKTKDTGNLDSAATRVTDIWGTLADTDSAEYTKLAAVIAAAQAPFTGMKLNTATFARDAIDGGTVSEQWVLTTSDERVINEATTTVTDTHTLPLESMASVADFNQNPSAPSDANLVLWTRSLKEYNDSMVLHSAEYRLLTPQEAREFPETALTIDVSDLTSEGKELKLFAYGDSAPAATDNSGSGVQKVSTQIIRINELVSGVVYGFAKDTSQQKWEQEHTSTTSDTAPFDIASSAEASAIDDSTPTGPGGNFVKTGQRVQLVTHDHTGYTDVYELLDSNEKITFPGTHTRIDDAGIASDGIATELFDPNGSEPDEADPPDASKVKAVASETERVNRVTSKKVTYFKPNASDEEWIYGHTRKTTDPSNIKNVTILGAIYERGSEPSAPGASGLVLNHKEYFDLTSPDTSDLQGVLWFYGETTSADDEIFPRTKLDTDPYDLTSSAVSGAIVTTGDSLGSPTAPTTPPNLVLAHWMDAPLTDASASNQAIRLYFWELRTSQDAIEMDGTKAKIDDSGIESDGEATEVYTTDDGAPADAASPDASLKAVAHLDQELNQVKSKHVTYFDVNDAEEKWLFARTRILADASALKNLTIKGAVYDRGGGVPSAPGASGLVLNHTETFDITSPDTSDLQGILWFYGETTSADDEIFPRTKTETDPDGLDSNGMAGAIYTTGSPPGDPTPPGDLKIAAYIDIPLTNASASNKSLRLYRYDLTTSAEKIERAGTFVEDDPQKLESKAQETFIYNDGDPAPDEGDATITPPDDVEVDEYDDQQLNDGKWKRIVKWVINNSKNKWERLKKAITTDVGHVAQEARIVKILSTATPAADDTYNPDTTNLEFATAEVIPVSATQFAHIYTFSPLSAKNRRIQEGTYTATDPNTSLDGDAEQTQITANTSETTPTVSGRVCVRYVVKKIGRTLYEHKWKFDFRSLADAHVARRERTKTDSSALESEAITAEVWLVSGGAPSTPTLSGFVLRFSEDVEIENPLYRLRIYEWGLKTTAQDIEFRESEAEFDHVMGPTTVSASVVAWSGTAEDLADSLFGDNADDATFLGVQVKRLTPDKALQKLRYEGGDKVLHSMRPYIHEEQVRGVPTSSLDAGSLPNLLFTPGATTWGDSNAKQIVKFNFGNLRIQPFFIRRRRGRFLYRRIFSVSDLTNLFLATAGTTNDSAFLERLDHEVMYIGPIAAWSYTISGNRRLMIDFEFQEDNFKWFSDGMLAEGIVAVNSGSITSTGLYNATQLEAGFGPQWIDESDFSGFTT